MTKPESHRPLSRRRFLQGTGIGVSLAWHGEPLVAQITKANNKPQVSSRLGRDFLYGTWLYSPQDILPDRFRTLIENIANRDQFNIIRIFPPWDYYNPKRGEYRFDDLEKLLSVCDEFDVRVLMTVMLESAPYWLEKAHPEARYVDAAGKAVHLQGAGFHYTGGYPGLCFHWQPVRDAAAKFMEELVKLSARHRSLYAYDIWNEPHIVDRDQDFHADIPMSERLYCYCDATLGRFRQWLQHRYGTLNRLNAAWIRGYSSWETVDPPRSTTGTSADWLDWLHFIQMCTTEFLKFRVSTVRAIDTDHLIETHAAYAPAVGPIAFCGIQNWRMAQEVDAYGCSFYPDGYGWSIDQMAAQLEIIRSCSKGKDFWVTEMQGGQAGFGYLRDGGPVRARNVRTNNWLAVAAGAKAIVYFSYLNEGTGGEASYFGLVGRNGKSTERVEEAAKANRLIQARSALIKQYRPKPEVAILFDQDNALLTFSATGKEEPSMQSVAGYYKAFWQLDVWAECIEPTSISQYKVLVAPWHLIAKRTTFDKLREFVERGGILVLETAFGRFDEQYQPNEIVPGNGLHEVFGYREMDSVAIENGRLPVGALDQSPTDEGYYQADIIFSAPAPIHIIANTYLTPIEVLSATPIATCHGSTIAATKTVERGKIYYIGTNLGASIFSGDRGGIELLRTIVSESIRPPATSWGDLRPRLMESSGRALLTVFNDSELERTETISLSAPYKRATNIYTGQQHEINDSKIEISVPFKDVSVFDID